MKKRIISIILVLILCSGLSGIALAEGNATAGSMRSLHIRTDGSLWACGVAQLVDGTGGFG